MVARPNGLIAVRLCLAAIAITGVFYVPSLDAQPSSGTSALVPVEEMAVNESVAPGSGAVGMPVAPPPTPGQASTPQLAPVPALEPEGATPLQARVQPAQVEPTEEPTEEPTPPTEEPTPPTEEPPVPPDDTPLPESPLVPEPQNQDDPEEFGREFEDPEPTEDRVAQDEPAPIPNPTPPTPVAAPISERLPQTGRNLLVLAQLGAGLLLAGMTLRIPLRPGGHLLTSETLSWRDRELLILRTTVNCRSSHQCGRHVRISLDGGIDRETIDRVAAGPDASGWSGAEAALLRAADELHTDAKVSDDTEAALAKSYDGRQLTEIGMVVGRYSSVEVLPT